MKTRTHRLLASLFVLLMMPGCKDHAVVEATEWGIYSILAGLLTAGVGWIIANRIRVIDAGRATREKGMEEERAAREKKMEEERAAREKKMEEERTAREKKMEEERAAREERLKKERAAREEQRRTLHAFDRYRKELLAFANDAIDVLGRIQGLLATDPERIQDANVRAMATRDYFTERCRLAGKVSALVDRGRFYFPNHEYPGVGGDLGVAQRGLRDPVLNRLVAAQFILKATNYNDFPRNRDKWTMKTVLTGNEKAAAHLGNAIRHLSSAEQDRLDLREFDLLDLTISARRAFVSELFQIMQPRQWLEDVETAYGIKLHAREPENTSARDNETTGGDVGEE